MFNVAFIKHIHENFNVYINDLILWQLAEVIY